MVFALKYNYDFRDLSAQEMKKLIGRLVIAYFILISIVFGAGYIFAGLESLGIIPPPPKESNVD